MVHLLVTRANKLVALREAFFRRVFDSRGLPAGLPRVAAGAAEARAARAAGELVQRQAPLHLWHARRPAVHGGLGPLPRLPGTVQLQQIPRQLPRESARKVEGIWVLWPRRPGRRHCLLRDCTIKLG